MYTVKIAVVFFCVLTLFSSVLFADNLSVSVPCTNYGCNLVSNALGNVVECSMASLPGRVGAPSLPAIPIRIALPAGHSALSMEVSNVSYSPAGRVDCLLPVSPQIPTTGEHPFVLASPDHGIYRSDSFYPRKPALFTGSGVIWGIPVASVTVYPARWNPVSHELEYLSSLEVTLETEWDSDQMTVSRRTAESEYRSIELIKEQVVNPEDVSGSGAAVVQPGDLEYGQYIIVCPEAYQEEFQVLADWKTQKGIPAAVYTSEWVESNYSCYDQPQSIRAFLTDCRVEGADYALLGGDDDVLPGRRAFLSYLSINRPSDLYFVDLNDSVPGQDRWDSNGNHVWGEHDDIVEWHPDIWVGRATVNTETEAELFVNKVLFYEHVLSSWPSSASGRALVERRIGYSTGASYMGSTDTIWGSSDAELISALIPVGWQEEKRYESQGNNSTPLTIEMLNMGMNQVFHSSHGGSWCVYTAYGDLMDTTHVTGLENISSGGSVSIWHTTACLAGSFDSLCCFADAWLTSPNGGGFGSFNTQYGYYGGGGTVGISAQVCERFFHEYLVNDNFNHGIAHSLSIDYFCPPEWYSPTENVAKTYMLFGDPELPMWTEEPTDLWVMHPPSITGNTTVTVLVFSQGVALEDARVCLSTGDWKTADVYDAALTDVTGMAQLWAAPETTDPITVTVWAHNHNLYTGEIQVASTGIAVEDSQSSTEIESVSPFPAFTTASVDFQVSSSGPVSICLYDLQGRVQDTVASAVMEPGRHSVDWQIGSEVPSGLHFLRLVHGEESSTKPIMIIR